MCTPDKWVTTATSRLLTTSQHSTKDTLAFYTAKILRVDFFLVLQHINVKDNFQDRGMISYAIEYQMGTLRKPSSVNTAHRRLHFSMSVHPERLSTWPRKRGNKQFSTSSHKRFLLNRQLFWNGTEEASILPGFFLTYIHQIQRLYTFAGEDPCCDEKVVVQGRE